MSRSSPSYGDKRQDDADVRYEIATPTNPRGNNAEILLFDKGDTVEVIIHRVPDPTRYYINYPNPAAEELNPDPTEDQVRENAVAKWIVEDALEILSIYDPDRSDYTANSGNTHLNDVYFTCTKDKVDEAVFDAKEFLHTLEKKQYKHRQKCTGSTRGPQKDLK